MTPSFTEDGDGGEGPEPAKISEGGSANRKESSEQKRSRKRDGFLALALEARGEGREVWHPQGLTGSSPWGALHKDPWPVLPLYLRVADASPSLCSPDCPADPSSCWGVYPEAALLSCCDSQPQGDPCRTQARPPPRASPSTQAGPEKASWAAFPVSSCALASLLGNAFVCFNN